MITPKLNAQCNMVANYLYTDMNKSPEGADCTDVITALEALGFRGYARSQFINRFDNINETVFDCIINHMWGIDSYSEAK
jgi:hypothetical protein